MAQPSWSQALEVGILQSEDSSLDHALHWQRALRGGGFRVRKSIDMKSLPDVGQMPLLVIEDRCISGDGADALEQWVSDGGILLINAIGCKTEADTPHHAGPNELAATRLALAGLAPGDADPGLAGLYPRIVDSRPLVSPFQAGDGIRLGSAGIDQQRRIRAENATILARGYRLEPGPGAMVRPSDQPTITVRQRGRGAVVYFHFSLGTVAGCYPDSAGQATDCSGAGTARFLMRSVVANALWGIRGIQAPLPWETPGSSKVNVVITGDVHADKEAYQVRSARKMALALEDTGAQITYFISGKVARRFPEHVDALRDRENVSLATHSVEEVKYRPGEFDGASAIRDDVRATEALLAQPSWPEDRKWLTAFRTHGWASNETDAGAWSGMADAGIGLVFDHNADAILPSQRASAPSEWFEGDIARRLFVPMIESSVSTEADEFLLDESLIDRIASLGSPEPDPCCNDSVRFDAYADYVAAWHRAFARIGAVGGATEVWLWHPSTPVWKGGLERLQRMLGDMRDDSGVSFVSANGVATWAYNRERVSIEPQHEAGDHLSELGFRIDSAGELLPAPPGASASVATVSYWVIGEADPPGWQTRRWRDNYDRTITVMTRTLELPRP